MFSKPVDSGSHFFEFFLNKTYSDQIKYNKEQEKKENRKGGKRMKGDIFPRKEREREKEKER